VKPLPTSTILISDVSAEYEIRVTEKLSVVPGVSYQHVKYDDSDYYDTADSEKNEAFLNGKSASIATTSGFLRTDFRAAKNLRIVAAIRADKFSSPDDIYLAYEFATTYKINEKNLIRAAITRSNSGSFIGVINLNLVVQTPIPGLNVIRSGNKNVELLTVNMIELGFRSQLSKSLQIDLDIFRQHAENFNAILIANIVNPAPGVFIPNEQQFRNVPTTASQIGVTFSINFVPNEKIQVKPFITIQKTETEDLASTYMEPSKFPVTYSDSEHRHTPTIYGGYYMNFKASEKFNLNISGYYFSSHRQYAASDIENESDAGDINGTFLVNMKVNYAITKQFNAFFNARNILNSDTRQYFGTDKIGGLYLLGISFGMN
jgi:iron complex outermembrane receptor protein